MSAHILHPFQWWAFFPLCGAGISWAILFKKATTIPIYTDPEGSWVSALIPIVLDDEVFTPYDWRLNTR